MGPFFKNIFYPNGEYQILIKECSSQMQKLEVVLNDAKGYARILKDFKPS